MKIEIELSDHTLGNIDRMKAFLEKRLERKLTIEEIVYRCFFAGLLTIEMNEENLEKYYRLADERIDDEKKKDRTDR